MLAIVAEGGAVQNVTALTQVADREWRGAARAALAKPRLPLSATL
jgi:hypothetical protein